ncbi:MAG: TAXI family TRAP transporter solute-binding subunit [Desulfobacterales bacterium]
MRKKVFKFFMMALMLCLVMGIGSAAAKSEFVAVGGGPTGGTFNYFANGFSTFVPKQIDGLKMSSEGSGGSVENVRRVHAGDFDFGISYAVDIGLGAEGGLPEDDNVYDKVRCIGYLYGAPAQLVVRADSEYQSAMDLKGKRVAVGNSGSGAATSAERFFRHIGVWDEFKPQFLGYSSAASAFQDGKIDAFWVLVGYPNASVIEAATQTKIRLIDVGKDAEKTGFYDEYAYAPTVIPEGTYRGQEEDCHTFQDSTLLTVRDDVDDDIVYKITKVIWSEKGIENMRDAHDAAKEMSIENGFKNASRPLAKGAAKFWKEQGKEIPEELEPTD